MPASSKKRKILDSEDEESVSSEPSFNDDESMSFDDDDSDAKPQKKKAKSPTKPKAVKEAAKSKSPKKQQEPKESKVSAKSEPPPQTMPSSSSSGPSSTGADITQGPPVSTDAAAKKLVLMYMKQQNRPYSLLQIFENLHKRIPKPTLERVLNTMSGPGGELLCKEYSKTKIYYLDQTALSASFPIKQLDSLQEENQILAEELDDLKNKTKQLQTALNQITTEPADNEIDRYFRVVCFLFVSSADWPRLFSVCCSRRRTGSLPSKEKSGDCSRKSRRTLIRML
jgi:chemotaxis protein histidine kinase CheA